jgi:hypothetical protein
MAPTPIGARNRLHALMARGWSMEAVAGATGMDVADLDRVLTRLERCKPDVPQRVASAYERLWNAQPPRSTGHEREAADAAAEHARVRSWAPPMAWLDDEEMDTTARPQPGWRRGGEKLIRAAALAEDVGFVREHGGYRHASNAEVALRLGITRERIEKALQRARESQAEPAELEAG